MARRFLIIAVLLAVFCGGAYYWYTHQSIAGELYKTPQEEDVHVRFVMEAYDKILANYWNKAADADLADLLRLSLVKAAATSSDAITLTTKDRNGTAEMLGEVFAQEENEDRKQLALDIVKVALYNLQPIGRNGLLSAAGVADVRNYENNIDPNSNLYQDIGVQKGATAEEINKAFEDKKTSLSASTSPEAKSELQKAAYAHQVLANEDTKARYDEAKVEPTVFTHILGGKTLYFYWESVSPTTLQEFGMSVINASTTPGLDSMIIDLRGNIGGTLDFAQYFLGLFLGENQYAFDLFHQGDYQVQRTVLPKLEEMGRYKEIAILTDDMTQSTAELITAAFKRFNIARVVGKTTRGWGTVENTFPMETVIDPKENYSLLLVHSITLRDDNQPIEGRGVDPDVNTNDPQWKKELSAHFRSRSLIDALSQEATNAPRR